MQRPKDKREITEISAPLEPIKVEDDDPMHVDPEIYADHAFLVTVSADGIDDYITSYNQSLISISKKKSTRLRKAWFEYTDRIRKTPPLLIASSYPPRDAGTKYIHGIMIVTGLPDPNRQTNGENSIWKEKKWGEDFPIQWIIHCADHNNLMRTTYDLSSKMDMAEIPKGLATLAIQELKTWLGKENNKYLRKYCGQYIFKRVEQIFSEGASASRAKRIRPAVKIEYETEPPQPTIPTPVPPIDEAIGIGLGKKVNVEEIFGRTPPHTDYWNPSLNDLHFQVIDTDYCDLPSMDTGGMIMEYFSSPVAPVLRLFGATKEGHSVVAQVRCFSPYFYVRTPEEIVDLLNYTKYNNEVKAQLDKEAKAAFDKEDYYDPSTLLGKIASQAASKGACKEFARALSNALIAGFTWSEKQRYGYVFDTKRYCEDALEEGIATSKPVLNVTLVRREGLIGHRPHLDWFFKVTMISPHFVKPARNILESGTFMWFEPDKDGRGVKPRKYQVFEANIPFALRFMIDVKQAGCSWVTLKKNQYTRWECTEKERATFADIEVLCRDTDVITHPPDDPAWTDHAPVRSLTLDIECDGRNGRFPLPDLYDGDPVICLSAHVSEEVPEQSKQLIGKILFSWGICAETGVSHMMCYYQKRGEELKDEIKDYLLSEDSAYRRCGVSKLKDDTVAYWSPKDEATMLRQFRDFLIRIARPHVLSGYNANNFDLPYLLKRAAALGLGEEFDCLGWIKGQRTKVKTKVFSSKAYGSRVNHELNIPGRITVDVLHLILRAFKQRSYTLNGSSERHLGTDKEGNANYTKAEMPHEIIGFLWNHNDDSRALVASYCDHDVMITRLIFQKLYMWLDVSELARAARVPIKYIIDRGQQIRIMTLLLWTCKQYLLVAPVEPEDKTKIDDDKYKGATVIDPIPGFYIDPVTTLDFSSLYPSIMIANNLCYSTILDGNVDMPEDQIYTIHTDQGTMRFVKQAVRLGVFVMVLEGLLAARTLAKAGAAANKDANDKLTPKGKMYDIRQNALKMTANSGYGMAGATKGLLPCRGISASVTKIGRDGIDLTAQVVTRPYAEVPASAVEFEFQYHERVKTVGWPFDEKKMSADQLKAIRMDYFKNRRPESKEQHKKRCEEALASYPLPRLPDETIEQHQERILESIDFIYGDTDSIMILQKKCKNAEEAIAMGQAFAKWVTKWFFQRPMAVRLFFFLCDKASDNLLFRSCLRRSTTHSSSLPRSVTPESYGQNQKSQTRRTPRDSSLFAVTMLQLWQRWWTTSSTACSMKRALKRQ